jgi:predicted nucleic acid-binding Zn ribbon protein
VNGPTRDPVPLRDALAGVGRDLGLPDPDHLTALLDAWPGIVGDTLARHATVRSLRDGVLVVAVDSPAVATQVKYLESEVRAAAAKHGGPGVVRRLNVVVQTPREPRS